MAPTGMRWWRAWPPFCSAMLSSRTMPPRRASRLGSQSQLCLERSFTILDSLVDSWPGFLSRDGVHPSRLGNKVLADFLHWEACALSTHLERRRIQQSYKESKASARSPVHCGLTLLSSRQEVG
ncbi:uncharacterized protein LOC119173506 isoform X6 [Rhipicephalus microplus]|uniref:uncharacterized protein LOC119173506 isoform X6 n=1 Tax=Rhipicephalus microplus TaxID=6941 RepID=UPI003F6C2043